ncbi:hypothetical protein PPERSA_06833 [Pseudocohnilembus persalinus]|uniref:Tyrosine specific protein phosphatases domain-containing protein n=1 Tax=Pseudocohnilembus persalinus TaxID=266149 RepID=A0A0V0QSE2_PSEPJ|nr:hypothetical protein PPERSA_06833 [Pseudocohnilembus persalinus]|eukprot:KRX05199.1 hypothetical protein PPERSA_06833 [Pseudocohnilembus persalinus]
MEKQQKNQVKSQSLGKCGIQIFQLQYGTIIQGGYDAIKQYYQQINEQEKKIIIVNCAKRVGENSQHKAQNQQNCVYYFIMTEQNQQKKCEMALQQIGEQLKNYLLQGYTIIIHCSEGVHRSKEFTKQLLQLI